MRTRLLELLRCPACGQTFRIVEGDVRQGELSEGALQCEGACRRRVPVRDGVPRMVVDASLGSQERLTKDRFGYQWTHFGKEPETFEANFLAYLDPVPPSFFQGKLGLDAGCGFGRHIYQASRFGAEMVGLDMSAAIDVTRRATAALPNVHLVQGDLLNPPLPERTFDFVYSLGVLHHLPEPQRGFESIVRLVKPGGMVMIWVYSTSRRWTNLMLESMRAVTTRLGPRTLHVISWVATVIDRVIGLVYRGLRCLPLVGVWVERWTPERIRRYSGFPFGVCLADWFDRLAAPIRYYYDPPALQAWAEAVGLQDVRIAATEAYGWRLHGTVPVGCDSRMSETASQASGCGAVPEPSRVVRSS